MRTRLGMVAASAALLLALGACGDDGGDEEDLGAGDTSDDTSEEASVEDALADDPTLEECQDALRTVLERFEVPDGIDRADGFDDDERAALESSFENAAEGFFDPSDEDHPCTEQLNSMTDEEAAAFIGQLDPEIVALLGVPAEPQFTPIEDEL
jgi:hypothetical protein